MAWNAATFAAAKAARPDLHPAQAIMQALGTGPQPQFTAAELIAKRDRELAFWAGMETIPAVAGVIANITRRYADKIAAAERRETVARIEATLATCIGAA